MTPAEAWDAHVARYVGTPYHEKLTPTAAAEFRAGWEAKEKSIESPMLPDSIRGIDPDFTGGMDSGEYLKRRWAGDDLRAGWEAKEESVMSERTDEIRQRHEEFQRQYSPGPDWEPFNQTHQDRGYLLAQLAAAEERGRGLREAAEALERAEDANANCPDCEGEGVPELCGTCFPLFDEARVKRREALTPPPAGEAAR